MRFGKRLKDSQLSAWRNKYLDYGKLKVLLREPSEADSNGPWTAEDENRFCDELFNVQLERVWAFQQAQLTALQGRVDVAFERLRELAPADGQRMGEIALGRLRGVEAELDAVMGEIKQLRQFASLNYTGFLKMAKKHDRRRGDRYKVRPLMLLSLARRPFHSERSYTRILNKLSVMYFAIRQQLENDDGQARPLDVDSQGETRAGDLYSSYKYWVHPDNLLEVKTYILRRLPALIYGSHASSESLDLSEEPTVTSLYFDNERLEVYAGKIERQVDCASVRLRWYGQLDGKTEIFVEKKTLDKSGRGREAKFTLREKHVKSYLAGETQMEKMAQKMAGEEQDKYRAVVEHIQEYIRDKGLAPVVRVNYVRTAFQNPGDSRIRISIDTDLVFIREDTLDRSRPRRDPGQWHRTDIDSMEGGGYGGPVRANARASTSTGVGMGEVDRADISRFPFAVLEIKLKEDGGAGNRRRPGWVEELMGSHLLHAIPHFSKFVHGVATLLEDQVQVLPFWLSELESDIRRDPHRAFEEEEERRARRAEEELAIGSFLGTSKVSSPGLRLRPSQSPTHMTGISAVMTDHERQRQQRDNGHAEVQQPAGEGDGLRQGAGRRWSSYGTMLPNFSWTRYGRGKQGLPAGVEEPQQWIKNAGELRIEPKVWFANERTFLKWQSMCVLLGTLAGTLYAAAGRGTVAEVMGATYAAIAAGAAGWGYWILRVRRSMIIDRSGRDFDFMAGPIVLSAALVIALGVNLYYQWCMTMKRLNDARDGVFAAP